VIDTCVAFTAGVLIEAVAVMWLHYSERDAPVRAAACSMLQAGAQVVGLGESFASRGAAVAFVLGYGCGTFTAVLWKRTKGEGKSPH